MASLTESTPVEEGGREFAFDDADFAFVRRFMEQSTGIALGPTKREMVYNRLTKLLRRHGCPSVADYLRLVRHGSDEQRRELICALTTNVTSFFREPHHFTALRDEWAPTLLRRTPNPSRIRLWSAGCATGEEPYSLAMALRESVLARHLDRTTLILATDIDTAALETAKRAVYPSKAQESIGPELAARYGLREGEDIRMTDSLRQLIRFRPLNLFADWPMQRPFDVILCRNVMIYFDMERQRLLLDRFARRLAPGGWLLLGHSEAVGHGDPRFELIGRTAYRRTEVAA